MNFKAKNELDEKIRKEMKEMERESNRIINLLQRDDFPIELIKIRDFKKYFKKEKLPQITSINKTKNVVNTKNPYYSAISIDHDNSSTIPYKTYSSFYLKSKSNFKKGQKNLVNSSFLRKNKIKELSPSLADKMEREYNTLPLFYKKYNKNFVYSNNQLIEDAQLSERYKKKNDLNICIDKETNKILPLPKMPEETMFAHKKKNNYTPYLFKVQNFHLRKSLVLVKQQKNNTSLKQNYSTSVKQTTIPHENKPQLSIIEI